MKEKQNKKPILKGKTFYSALIILSGLFYLMPTICRQVASLFVFREYLHLDAPRLSAGIKKGMLFPWSKWLSYVQLNIIAVVWFAVLVFLFIWVWRLLKPYRKIIIGSAIALLIFLFIFPNSLLWFENNQPSISAGHVANGTISNAKRFPLRGDNHTTYSFAAYLAGRTYVHSALRTAVLESYKICQQTCPNTTFVMGEIGLPSGGDFLPHRTHENGLSVDFMTPQLKDGKDHRSNHVFNLWGYALEFDDEGKKGNITVDYETVAQHLWALDRAAKQQGMIIQKVIFDPVLRKYLRKTSCWQKIKHLPYTKNRIVWRHDDHYHVDFGFPSNGRN